MKKFRGELAMISFQDFAKRIASVLKSESNVQDFIHTLFSVILPEDQQELLKDKPIEHFRYYYSGKNTIKKLAKKIKLYIKPKLFENYINGYHKDVKHELCTAFNDILPDINEKNAGKLIAELFCKIIKEAANETMNPSNKNSHNNTDGYSNLTINGNNNIVVNNSTITAPINNTAQSNQITDSAEKMIAIQRFSKEYYQLIVTENEDAFTNNVVTVSTREALTHKMVPSEILERCSPLTDQGIEELKTFPAIICKKNTGLHGTTDPTQMAMYCYIKRIKKEGKNIKITFSPIAPFEQRKMCNEKNANYFDLVINCDLTDLNLSAWSVHKVNLFDAFEKANIFNMPKPI